MKENLKEELKKNLKLKSHFLKLTRKWKRILELSKTLKLPGFRPGKIPISFVEK